MVRKTYRMNQTCLQMAGMSVFSFPNNSLSSNGESPCTKGS